MIRLIKKTSSDTFYWQVWKEEKQLHILSGKLGVQGSKELMTPGFFESSNGLMKKLAKEQVNQGYEYVEEDSLTKIAVQYRYNDESQFEAAEEKTLMVEDLLDEVLHSTGNGQLYGSEVGDGAGTTFVLAVNLQIAMDTIVKELTKHNVMDGAEIAYQNGEGTYVGLYPEGIQFELV